MALWENLSKKASGTKAKAVHQAKVLSESTRLNGLISDAKKEIESKYYQLGKLYATVRHDDYEEDFAELMTAIIASEQKIEAYQEQIRDIKGVLCCTNCGAEIAKGSVFCSACGTAVPRSKEPDANVCGSCGAAAAEGMRFCTSCGKPLVKAADDSGDQQEEEAVVIEKRTCPNCKAELEDDMIFCMDCGTKVQ